MLKRWRQNEFLSNVAILFSGSTVAQAIPILIAPLLSRLYLPDYFAELAVFVSSYTILSLAAGFRYDMAIMLPKTHREGVTLFFITNILTLTTALISAVVIFLFKDVIQNVFKLEGNGNWLYLIPVALIVKNLVQSAFILNNRLKKFKRVAKSKVYQTIISSGVTVGLGLAGQASGLSLMAGKLSGLLQNAFYLTYRLKGEFKKHRYNRREARTLMKRYRFFPFFSVPNGFLNTLSVQLPSYLLLAYFDKNIAGLYAFSYRLIISPLNLIAQSLRDVYFQRLAERHNEGTLTRKLLRVNYLKVFRVSIAPFIIGFLAAPYVFGPVFGARWAEAGVYVQIITPWLFMTFMNMPLTTLPAILNKQHVLLVYNTFLVIFRFLALWGGYTFFKDIHATLILFSAVGVLFNLIYLKLVFKMVSA